MAINAEEILIFKMRGAKPAAKAAHKEEKAEEQGKPVVAAPAPQPAPRPAPIPEKVQQPIPEVPQKPKMAKETKEGLPGFIKNKLFEREAAPKEEAKKKPEVPAPELQPELPREMAINQEEARRIQEIESLEEMANLYTPVVSKAMKHERPLNSFSMVTGVIFIVNAAVFGYFIYPQSEFVIGYMLKSGIQNFAFQWNYNYSFTMANAILALASALSGILMFTRFRLNHLAGGVTATLLIIAGSYEYLNSSASYLLLVSVLAFASIIALAFTRMSAVSMYEGEEPLPHEIPWPRLETF